MTAPLTIRLLTESDIDFADQVRATAGWNQRRPDWQRFIRHAPDGCFLAEWEGEPAGTVTTTHYPGGLAWIGMMLVHSSFRRRGIASALMEQAIFHLQQAGTTCIKLDATADGEPVYARLGFRPEWDLDRWMSEPHAAGSSAPPTVMDFALPEFDQPVFGDDRSEWLAAVGRDARQIERIHNDKGDCTAFGMLRNGMRADYLGPVVAANVTDGVAVARRLLAANRRETFWDIPADNTAATRLATEWGFKKVRSLRRMWLGEQLIPTG